MDEAATISRVRKADSVDHTPASQLSALPRHIVARAGHRVGTAALTWAGAYVAAISVNEYAAHSLGRLPAHGGGAVRRAVAGCVRGVALQGDRL